MPIKRCLARQAIIKLIINIVVVVMMGHYPSIQIISKVGKRQCVRAVVCRNCRTVDRIDCGVRLIAVVLVFERGPRTKQQGNAAHCCAAPPWARPASSPVTHAQNEGKQRYPVAIHCGRLPYDSAAPRPRAVRQNRACPNARKTDHLPWVPHSAVPRSSPLSSAEKRQDYQPPISLLLLLL